MKTQIIKPLLLLIAIVSMFGCAAEQGAYDPKTPTSPSTVFGKCRFCGKPGYSADTWGDASKAQAEAETRKEVRDSIVCGKCRAEMSKTK